jgi:hypothetical protein
MNSIPAKVEASFVETTIDDETVIMHVDRADFYSLNPTAGAVWRLIDGARDRDAIVAELARDYGAPADEIGPGVDAVLAEFRGAGFVTGG